MPPTVHKVLVVASEWDSRHGGLSSLNREFCRAVASLEHEVVCLVPTASQQEISDALRQRVKLLAPSQPIPGLSEDAQLCLPGVVTSEFTPTIVVGHGHVSGPAAMAIARSHFPEAKRIHFVHTAPTEIEWFKKLSADSQFETAAAKAEAKERLEAELARSAYLVVAVGSRLYREWQTRLN